MPDEEAPRRHEWSPPWAPHVKGHFFEIERDESGAGDAEVGATCEHPGCGEKFSRRCSSGLMRQHIARFAILHLHRHPLEEPARK